MGIKKILIDLKGQKFGRLTVIKRMPDKNKRTRWLCKCDCGTEKIIRSQDLRRGSTKSCGCINVEIGKSGIKRRLKLGLASMRTIISQYKIHAKEREVEYILTEQQFLDLTQQDCYYCGIKPNNKNNNPICNGNFIYNGLDRIDNKKGYTTYNVVPCCKDCNQAKGKRTLQEFQDWIEKIYKKMKEPNEEIQNKLLYYEGD